MKILIVNYYYPPLIDAHAYRWAQIARHWAALGHKIEVITGPVAGAPRHASEDGVDVTRTGAMTRPVGGFSSASIAPSSRATIKSRIINFIRPLYRKLYWPDGSWHWTPYLLVELFRRRAMRFDLVVSYYPCMGALLGVRALRAMSPHPFTWIVDYGDPFSTSNTMQPNNYALYSGLNRFAERAVAYAANYLVFTNQPTADACAASLGYADKMLVIPHLVDISQFYAELAWQPKGDNAPLVLDYIGGFHKGIREPGRLFDLMRELNRQGGRRYLLRIHGPLNGFSKDELSPRDCPEISYLGPLERSKAVEMLKSADAIVNVDNQNCIMTPSKIVECIATGRPIVNITNKETFYPPLESYVKCNGAISIQEPIIDDGVAQRVRDFLEKSRAADTISFDIVKDTLSCHTLETIAERYINLCRS